MKESGNLWFRIGYALERARHEPAVGRLRGLEERLTNKKAVSKDAPAARSRQRDGDAAPTPGRAQALDALRAAGTEAAASRILALLPARKSPGALALLRAGTAGAGAALLRELLDPLLRGELRLARPGPGTAHTLLAGAARGLLYAGALEPRLPGPPALRGLVYGSIEYITAPMGGLSGLLGHRAPHRRIPLLAELLDDDALGEDSYLDHVAFGVALALLYRPGGDANSGISDDE